MVGVLIVSHGGLAEALISSLQHLVGKQQKVRGVSIWPEDREQEIKGRIRREITELNDGDGVVILTDVLGGTATSLSLSFIENEKVELITGANMPMLLALSSYRTGKSLREIGKLMKKAGRRSIILAKQLLGSKRIR